LTRFWRELAQKATDVQKNLRNWILSQITIPHSWLEYRAIRTRRFLFRQILRNFEVRLRFGSSMEKIFFFLKNTTNEKNPKIILILKMSKTKYENLSIMICCYFFSSIPIFASLNGSNRFIFNKKTLTDYNWKMFVFIFWFFDLQYIIWMIFNWCVLQKNIKWTKFNPFTRGFWSTQAKMLKLTFLVLSR
jgi:hypothetical protein